MLRLTTASVIGGVMAGLLVLVLVGGTTLLGAALAIAATALVATVGAVTVALSLLRPYRELPDVVRTMERRFQSSLAASQQDRAQMAAIFEHMADGLLVLDPDERITLSNPAASRLLRQTRLEGSPVAEGVRDHDLVETIRAAAVASPVTKLVELRSDPKRTRLWLHVVATRVPSDLRTLVLLQDVTELRMAEAARRDFVANVSHELRTPVASLKALVETLEAGAMEDPAAGPDFLRRMHVEVDGLAQLVTELLELARIEAGRLDLDLQRCRADELVRDAVERIRPYAARVGLSVGCVVPPDEAWVTADARRVGQVLSNLLSNAVKFTPPGGQIQASLRQVDCSVEISVSDTGVGIASDQLIRVFERFYKIDPSRAGSGTGLGLAICKHVVRAHQGEIWAASPGLGRGATFTFTLPLAEALPWLLPETPPAARSA